MLRRTSFSALLLASLLGSLLSPSLSNALPRTLSSSAALTAQAATSSTLTLTPAPLNLGAPAVALKSLQLPAVLDVDVPVSFAATWSGEGAVLDTAWEVVYLLRGPDGAVAAELTSELSLAATLQMREPGEPEEFWVSSALPAGSYNLSVLVRDPWGGRAPLALGIAGAQADGSYHLGSVEVAAPTPAVTAMLAADTPASTELDASVAEAAVQSAYAVYLPSLARPLGPTVGSSRGYLITPQELRAIKQKADQGKAPYAANVRELLNHSSMSSASTWVSQSSLSGNVVCSDGSQKDAAGNTLPKGPIYLIDGSRQVYGKMLTAILKGGAGGEAYARNARARILDLTDTTGWGGDEYSGYNQCILYMAWYLPSFVIAADLLEAYPSVWTASDKSAFQKWLAAQVYHKVAWSSRARTSNWGSSGSYAAALIADYLWDSGLTLRERAPVSRTLTPGQAYREHINEQLSRMSTSVAPRDEQDSRCLPYKGIQPNGGIPDELRRAQISNPLSLCAAPYLPTIDGGYSTAYNYHAIQLEHLVATAEFALRRGDRRLYDNMAADKSGSILRGIRFVIANPVNPAYSYGWDVNRKAMLYIAQRYYRDAAVGGQLYKGEALRSGHTISYGRLTHAFASGETIGSPPTVSPPR